MSGKTTQGIDNNVQKRVWDVAQSMSIINIKIAGY
jgi:hypothetical protein